MRPTKTLIGNKARLAILRGVNAIYEPVRNNKEKWPRNPVEN